MPRARLQTWGNGDPAIPAEVQAAHDSAAARGERTYRDPRDNGVVVTTVNLWAQGDCCGNGCRHCPYPADQQRRANRQTVRPAAGT